jgi:hypothetical protein
MGSGFDVWIYWHFLTITVNYNSSHTELLLNDVCLTNLYEESLTNLSLLSESLIVRMSLSLSLSLMLRPTVSRPVCLGIKHPSGAYDQIFITCVTVTVLFLWGALSDERSYVLLTLASAVFLGS